MSLVLNEDFLRRLAEEENRETERQDGFITTDDNPGSTMNQQKNLDATSNGEAAVGGGEGKNSCHSHGSDFSPELLKRIVEEFPRLEARVAELEKENCKMMELRQANEKIKVLEAKTLPKEKYCCIVPDCQRKAKFKWMLLRHQRTQHPELSSRLHLFKCGVCVNGFHSRTALLCHRNIQHGRFRHFRIQQQQSSSNGGERTEAETGSVAPVADNEMNMHHQAEDLLALGRDEMGSVKSKEKNETITLSAIQTMIQAIPRKSLIALPHAGDRTG